VGGGGGGGWGGGGREVLWGQGVRGVDAGGVGGYIFWSVLALGCSFLVGLDQEEAVWSEDGT